MPRIILAVFLMLLLVRPCARGYEFMGYLAGENTGDQMGSAFGTVDFNDDGYPDLIVSAPAADEGGLSSGKVYVYLGGPWANTVADIEIVGPPSSFFGKALSSAGDFNYDGHADLLVGAPFYDDPATSAGAVLLYYGGTAPDTTPDHVLTGESGGDYFGIAVSGVGDFNNDGFDDFAVGAYRADWGSFTNSGKVYIYYGGPSPDVNVDKILVGNADGERFGYAITAGDFNGDNVSDVVVGAYSYDDTLLNKGCIYIFYGGSMPDSIPDLTITGDSAGYKFGWSLTGGLINTDNYRDLIMGTDGYPIDTFSAGKVYIFHGGPSVDAIADDGYTLGRTASDYLGFSVASGIDLNSDDHEEIIAGMPGNDDGANEAGGAVLLTGADFVSVDTTFYGSLSGEEVGYGATLWQGYGDMNSFIVALGAPHYSDYRGRVYLYVRTGGAPNRPPVLDPVGSRSVKESQNLNFTVSAYDPDGDTVELSAENLPAGAIFTDDGWDESLSKYKGTFSWTPESSQIGTYDSVRFIASDGILQDDEYITIGVHNFICGDVDGDGSINMLDILVVIAYLYKGGASPDPQEAADVDSDGSINMLDIIYLVAYLYKGGATPHCP